MHQVLLWIGFDVAANRQALRSKIAEIKYMTDRTAMDVTELQELYAKRAQNAGHTYFGLQHTKRLKATLDWVQDFVCLSKVPTLEGLNQESFKAAILVAAQRADTRKKEANDASWSVARKAQGRQECIAGFKNMMLTLLGVNGVPLLYVIRENRKRLNQKVTTRLCRSASRVPLWLVLTVRLLCPCQSQDHCQENFFVCKWGCTPRTCHNND